jgi:hypothetical protein
VSSMDDHEHRPGPATQRAVLAAARAILKADPDAAHDFAGAGGCPECMVISALQLGFTLCSVFAGDKGFMSELTRARLLNAVGATEDELRGFPN